MKMNDSVKNFFGFIFYGTAAFVSYLLLILFIAARAFFVIGIPLLVLYILFKVAMSL